MNKLSFAPMGPTSMKGTSCKSIEKYVLLFSQFVRYFPIEEKTLFMAEVVSALMTDYLVDLRDQISAYEINYRVILALRLCA